MTTVDIYKNDEETIREAFELFDLDKIGTLNSKQIGNLLRSLGAVKSNEELSSLQKEIDKNEKGKLDFNGFLKYYKKFSGEQIGKEEIIESFGIFDRENNGFVSKSELKHVLMTMGEKMNDNEIKEFFEIAEEQNDKIDYRKLTEKLTRT